MAKDQFEKFKEATLGSIPSLEKAIRNTPVQEVSTTPPVSTPSPAVVPAPVAPLTKASKLDGKEQVAFYLDRSLKKQLGLIKYQHEISFNDLYEEAIRDLIAKYGL